MDQHDYQYIQEWNGQKYELKTSGNRVTCYINNELIFEFSKGARLVTDLAGNPLKVISISTKEIEFQFNGKQTIGQTIFPNSVYDLQNSSKIQLVQQVPFFEPGQ